MGRCVVDTGVIVSSSTAATATAQQYRQGSAPGTQVLFTPGGTELSSRVICVPADKTLFVSVYNLPADAYIEVNKVVLAAAEMPTADSCVSACIDDPGHPPVLYTKRFCADDCSLNIVPGVDEIELPGPGCFQLIVPSVEALAELYVEAILG